MADRKTFTCFKCRRSSGFSQRADKPSAVFKVMTPASLSAPESRLYFCEHCGVSNELEGTPGYWLQVEAGEMVGE